MTDWMSLKSGSDIRGTAVSTENGQAELTDEVIEKIVTGFYAWLLKSAAKPCLTVAVGRDSRISSPRIVKVAIDTLVRLGVKVIDCGMCTTPAMFMITVDKNAPADASVQVTASHHPFDKNGLKFFTPNGGLDGNDITEILQYACEGTRFSEKVGGGAECRNYLSEYALSLVTLVQNKTGKKKPLSGCKIIVDVGNGVGGFYADQVLTPLGADTSGSQFLEPDGYFPNHVPNPENKQAMASICARVKETNADFGIIFDTDVDRAGAVEKGGAEINRNRLIALISAILLREQSPATIVTDSVTSRGLTDFIESHGGSHHRFKRGYKNVINECIRLNREGIYSPLAIETSGHAAFKENYYLDDGAYLITRILVELASSKRGGLCDIISQLKQPAEEAEIRIGFTVSDFKSYGDRIIEELRALANVISGVEPATKDYEGVRLDFTAECGFALVRMSVHDPIMPINIESDESGGVKKIALRLYDMLKGYDGITGEKLLEIL